MNEIKVLFCILFFAPLTLFAQKKISARELTPSSFKALSAHFSKYSVFAINTAEITNVTKAAGKGNINFDLDLPGLANFRLSLKEHNILSAGYQLSVTSDTGKQLFARPACITYSGALSNETNSSARLTITKDFLYGTIKSSTKEYFIEPLHYFTANATPGTFIIYETKDAIIDSSFVCGVSEREQAQQKISQQTKATSGINCVVAQMAIASDRSMFVRYGSPQAVETHNIGVMNNVIWDYTNAQFSNNIEFTIAGQNVSTTAASDQLSPAYTGNNANTILANFRAWGQAGNFGFTYDIGQLWTTRNLDNDGAGTNTGIIGLAYVGSICGPSRYQLLEDFAGVNETGSGFALEILAAHETGHGFNCVHDAAGSGFIMSPSVANTHVWSDASITAVDAFVPTRACLAACNVSELLVTDYFANPASICAGGTVQFYDRTIGGPISWNWTFEGGTPLTSTERNPIVSFASAGIKNVVLVTNNGASSDVKGSTIIVSNPAPAACFPTGTGTSNAGVNSFSLNTINKVTGGLAADGSKYFDFSCSDNTILAAGTSYTATANVGTSTPTNSFNLVQFFIDYNNNGDFTDAGEAVYSSSNCWIGNHSFSFTTPTLPPVLNRLLRARLIAKDCFSGVNSCYNPTLGQVEDYGVIFLAPATACDINYWTGTQSTAWEDASNWSCGNIPDAGTKVIIGPGKPNYPEVQSMAVCKSLHNSSGTTILIIAGFQLEIVGSN